MAIASDLFRTITVKINDISQQLPYIVVNQADDNGKIIRFVPLDHGQKVTGFTGARLYYPPRSDNTYGDYVTGVESDGAWDFTIPVGALSAGRVECNLAFIDGDGETYSRNVVFLVEPAVSGVFDPGDGQQTRLDKIIGTVQTAADTAIDNVNETADSAVERVNKTASDAVGSIGKAEESISESVTAARGSAEAAANSANQAATSASAAQTSERNAANSATQASQSATAAKQSEDNAAESARNAAESERNAASSAEQAANIVASVSGSVTQAENAALSASQSAASAAGSASVAGGSAQAAADSASKAGESATAAGTSERNAASSATQAPQSATAAAQSASEAQNAVDGFGLQVGTTTTGEPGTNAAVEIQKTGTKYTANFTIPRGDVGPVGVNENVPLGSTSGVVAQATDAYPALPRKVQVHGRTADGHNVEPTKLVAAGKNLIPIGNISSGSSNGINWKANDDKTFTVSGTSTKTVNIHFMSPDSRWSLPKGRYTVKAIGDLQNNIRMYIRKIDLSTWFVNLHYERPVQNINIDEGTVFTECSVRIPSGVKLENSVYGIQIELGDSDTSYEAPNIKSLDFTQSISLSDGDTLTIDRDGTTQIIHAEGEPTVLENVTLPELPAPTFPAPTFNVYTTGGSVPSTVDVDYERDINIVINKLEQAMAVQAATMKVKQLTD